MALVTSLERDVVSMRQAIARLSSIKLGPTATPKFADLTLTGDLAVGGNIDLTGTLTLSALTASRLIATNASKELVSSDLNSWITGTADEINIADDGDGTVTIGIADPLIVGKGGTGAATLTDHSILVGSGTDAITAIGAATNGQLPIGSTGNDPQLDTLTGTANQIIIANGPGSITLSLPQDYDTSATPTLGGLTTTGTIDASSGEVLVEDNATSAPENKTDGYVGVAKIGAQGRIYFEVEGVMYYVSADAAVVSPTTGNPIGLGLLFTYV